MKSAIRSWDVELRVQQLGALQAGVELAEEERLLVDLVVAGGLGVVLLEEAVDSLGFLHGLVVLLADEDQHGDVALDGGVGGGGPDRQAVERRSGEINTSALTKRPSL